MVKTLSKSTNAKTLQSRPPVGVIVVSHRLENIGEIILLIKCGLVMIMAAIMMITLTLLQEDHEPEKTSGILRVQGPDSSFRYYEFEQGQKEYELMKQVDGKVYMIPSLFQRVFIEIKKPIFAWMKESDTIILNNSQLDNFLTSITRPDKKFERKHGLSMTVFNLDQPSHLESIDYDYQVVLQRG
jgi:hypothetical protein